VIARWKGIVEEIHFGGSIMPLAIIENLDLEKPSFGPSKWPRKLKTAKNSKLPKLPENCFEPVGKGGWPPISTWINNTLMSWDNSTDRVVLGPELLKKMKEQMVKSEQNLKATQNEPKSYMDKGRI
jgi:hypothetical protein